jgi:hypothetical protein
VTDRKVSDPRRERAAGGKELEGFGRPELSATPPGPLQARPLRAHIWAPADDDHYVEPEWVARRLFEVERFVGAIHDPSAGFGTVVHEARRAGLKATGSDLVDRSATSPFGLCFEVRDFLTDDRRRSNVAANPPYSIVERFVLHAIEVTRYKVAVIFPIARLPAAHWLKGTPLRRVWLLSPRPSMPPGHYLAAGKRAGGGRKDFCWLVFERGFNGRPEMQWLYRDPSPPMEESP